MDRDLLKKELQTYEDKKKELVSEHPGKYVLIKEDKIIGIFEFQKAAINSGFEKFGNVPFLVKKIELVEQKQNFTSNLIITGN
ncbi:MAG: hypothetical protein V1676_03545 [Candidatus Diapherotrites archaeon]